MKRKIIIRSFFVSLFLLNVLTANAQLTKTFYSLSLSTSSSSGMTSTTTSSNPTYTNQNQALYVGYDALNYQINRGYLQFDLSGIPTNATVNSVKLHLKNSSAIGTNTNTGGTINVKYMDTPLTTFNSVEDWNSLNSSVTLSSNIVNVNGPIDETGANILAKVKAAVLPGTHQLCLGLINSVESSNGLAFSTGNSDLYLTVTYTPATPTTPTGLVASSISSSGCTLSWNNATGTVSNYKVYMNGSLVQTVTSNNCTINNLSAATAYSFYVIAHNDNGDSEKSSTINITTCPLSPSAPTNLVSSNISSTSCSLSWTPQTNATGYKVYQNGALVQTVSVANAAINNLSSGASNIFTVSATNCGGESSQSTGITVLTKPSIPNLSMGSVTSTSVNLTWNVSSGAVSGYKIYNNGSLINTTSATTASISLTSNTQYQFSVSSYNDSGESTQSSILSISTTSPSAPTGLVVSNITTTSYTISWTPLSGIVKGYTVMKNGTLFTTTTNCSFDISGVQPGTNTTFVVSAYNDWGSSTESSVVALTKPLPPINLKLANLGCTYVAFTWSDNPVISVPVSGYCYYFNGVKKATITGNGTVYSGLTPNTHYSITVSSFYNSSGESNQSSPLDFSTLASPTAPTDFHINYNSYLGYILSWTGSSTYSYNITQVSPSSVSYPVTIAGSCTIGQLALNTYYVFEITAYFGGCTSAPVYTSFTTGNYKGDYRAPKLLNPSSDSIFTTGNFIGVDKAPILLNPSSNSTETNMSVSISPNPVVDKLFVTGTTGSFDAVIMNLQGQVIKSEKNLSESVDVSELKSGIYIVKIENKGNEMIRKIIKQ